MTSTSKSETEPRALLDEELPASVRGDRIVFSRQIPQTAPITTIAGATQSPGAVRDGPDPNAKTCAVTEALTKLGERADPHEVALAIQAQTGLPIDANEVAQIIAQLRERAQQPPSPDQPPPENAR